MSVIDYSKFNWVSLFYTNQDGDSITTKKYDLLGREILVTNAAEETTHKFYFIETKTARREEIDAKGIKKSTHFDAFGHPVLERRYDPLGCLVEEIAYTYDLNGNKILRQIKTEEKFIETGWEYDTLNRLIKTLEALGTDDQKCLHRIYDPSGRLKKLTKNDGTVLTNQYDALGRKRSLKSSDGSIHYTFSYDKCDNLLTAKDEMNDTAITREYDEHHQLSKEILPFGHEINYAYDRLGNIKLVTLPDDTTVAYQYEGDHLQVIKRRGTLNYSHAYEEYDQASNPTRINLPVNAGELQIEYDLLNRPVSMKTTYWKETLKYEQNLLKKRSLKDEFGKITSQYSYDAKEQLLSESGVAEHTFKYNL